MIGSRPPHRAGVPSRPYERIRRVARDCAAKWNQIGTQTQFYAITLRSTGDVLVKYKTELARLIAQMAMGTGALILIGGTVTVVGFLMLAGGALVGQEGFRALENIGIEALLGFLAAYIDVRLVAPLIATVALSATIGAGATAQLGAMRINEEIDALEVIGVRSVAYLASSRVIAGLIVVVPLFCLALLMAFVATEAIGAFYGQSSGVYNHYFDTFLYPEDIFWSLLLVMASGTIVMLIHTYYGYTAAGGPAGVGEAVGQAVRTSLVATVFVMLFMSLAIYGRDGNFNLSG